MKICVVGGGHLAETTAVAAQVRGFTVRCPELVMSADDCDLCMVAVDVLDHSELGAVNRVIGDLLFGAAARKSTVPVVILSQVPPGYTRRWREVYDCLYYQVDTIIVDRALDRMVNPEQIVVGVACPDAPLPITYQRYLLAHQCPVHVMSYESAEVAKCAINFALASQIELAHRLDRYSRRVGADYADVERVLRGDARIGPHAYLRPGEPNQHLLRDVTTIDGALCAEDAEQDIVVPIIGGPSGVAVKKFRRGA